MLKRIWNDPVWASVIATGIAAGLGGLGAYFLGYWPTISSSLSAVWSFFLAHSEVSNWLIFLLAIPSVLFGVLVIAGLWSHWFGEGDRAVNWQSYTVDNFFGLRWRWRYDGGSIEGLSTFCQHCDYQVFPRSASAYEAIDRIEFSCDSCHSHVGTFNESMWDLQSKVVRLIQQKIRSGSWITAKP